MIRNLCSALSIALMLPTSLFAGGMDGLNPAAAETVLYEMQVQSSNACDPNMGSEAQKAACRSKIASPYSSFNYSSKNGDKNSCSEIQQLQKIKLGTFDDMLADTNDYESGITLKYIRDKLGPVMVWLQPPFPHNDRFNLPNHCDNTGSPYASRDYVHMQGKLSASCIKTGLDENSAEDGKPQACWGTSSFVSVVQKAKQMGLKVMLDVAFNHFGHNYQFYDYEIKTPIRDRIQQNQNLDDLWRFGATYEPGLLNPHIVDSEKGLDTSATQSLIDHCKSQGVSLQGDLLVRAVNMWREMMDWEREQLNCSDPVYLEYWAPGFYLGSRQGVSTHLGDNFSDPDWSDVKFLFLHEYQKQAGEREYEAFIRNREYLFRVLNYWASLGVDGFRLDHTADGRSGIGPNVWRYIIAKTNFYARKRWEAAGRPGEFHAPIFLAEEFFEQQGMADVVDIMTEGYIGDMRGAVIKDTSHVEDVLGRADRFNHKVWVMHALEDHDEDRALGFFNGDPWLAAGFWGIGAATPGVPMIHAGQEFAEPNRLSFKRSDLLRSRFQGNSAHRDDGHALVDFYGQMIRTRLDGLNRAFATWNWRALRHKFAAGGGMDARIFAQARFTPGGENVLFTFFNLWSGQIDQHFFIPPDLADEMSIGPNSQYRLVNALNGEQIASCQSGANLKMDFWVAFPLRRSDRIDLPRDNQPPGNWRIQWLRLERCN